VVQVTTYREGTSPGGLRSWSRTRWLLILGLVAAAVVIAVLVMVYSGGGSGGGGVGGGY
jgi:hypothetical protein